MTQVVNVVLRWYYLIQPKSEFAEVARLLREFKPKCLLKSTNSSLKTTYSLNFNQDLEICTQPARHCCLRRIYGLERSKKAY